MKSGGHDLKGLIALRQADMPALHLPLMALIDYRGFRVVAVSLLPIGREETLVYGSNNGGRQVHSGDDEVAGLMRDAARRLNIKEHLVGMGERKELLCMPCDIEVHRGYDGRTYMLDFARLFPPEAPGSSILPKVSLMSTQAKCVTPSGLYQAPPCHLMSPQAWHEGCQESGGQLCPLSAPPPRVRAAPSMPTQVRPSLSVSFWNNE